MNQRLLGPHLLLLLLACTLGFAPNVSAQLSGLSGRAAFLNQPAPKPPTAETWFFDESTSGADISWVSPGMVDPAAITYLVQLDIDTVEVSVSFLGIPFGSFDVTDQVPPDMLSSSSAVPGPAPLAFLNQAVVAPPPPDPVALGAVLSAGLSDQGSALVNATNVMLGTTVVDLGAPFGTVTVNITGFRIQGSVRIASVPWRLLPI